MNEGAWDKCASRAEKLRNGVETNKPGLKMVRVAPDQPAIDAQASKREVDRGAYFIRESRSDIQCF